MPKAQTRLKGNAKYKKFVNCNDADCIFASSGWPEKLYGFQRGNAPLFKLSIVKKRHGYVCKTGSVMSGFFVGKRSAEKPR